MQWLVETSEMNLMSWHIVILCHKITPFKKHAVFCKKRLQFNCCLLQRAIDNWRLKTDLEITKCFLKIISHHLEVCAPCLLSVMDRTKWPATYTQYNTLPLGCSSCYLHSSHHFLSTGGSVMLENVLNPPRNLEHAWTDFSVVTVSSQRSGIVTWAHRESIVLTC